MIKITKSFSLLHLLQTRPLKPIVSTHSPFLRWSKQKFVKRHSRAFFVGGKATAVGLGFYQFMLWQHTHERKETNVETF